MKLFSISSISQKAADTLRRFPISLIAALVAVIAMISISHRDWSEHSSHFPGRLAMTSYLSMLLTISVSLFAERFIQKRGLKVAISLLAVALAVLYFFSLPETLEIANGIRFAVLAIALHLLVAFAPFVLADEMNGLWQYNKSLFIGILTSGIYSAVLFGGLALALLAIENLFDVKVNDDFYFDLWLVIAGIFNTWFFLSGVPKDVPRLERATDYPKGLKVFTLYVLIPLITVYLVILYAYVGKIVITSNWPVGWVAYLVLAFSIFGILSFLLVYPLRNDDENPWVRFYSRLFYFLLIPLIVMLYISIFKRVDEYGITVARYYVMLLAVWLTFIAAYNILTGGKRIQVIPLSLCIIGLISTFGSWGAFAVSHDSQIDELTALLESNHVLVNGKVDTSSTHDVKAEDYDRIESVVGYIEEFHGHKELQSFFVQDIDSVNALRAPEGGIGHIANLAIIDILHIQRAKSEAGISYMSYLVKEKMMLNSAGYDFITELGRSDYGKNSDTTTNFIVGVDTVQVFYSAQQKNYVLMCRDFESITLDLNGVIAALPHHEDTETSPDLLTTIAGNSQWKAKLVLRTLNISRENGESKIERADGVLMIAFADAGERLQK